jgi:Rrf2 family protein
MLSRTEEYALRAAVCLARHYGDGARRARDIARETGVPANYMSKILHQLARAGVVRSERGRTGGFALSGPPEEFVLSTVVGPFEPQIERTRCLLGRPECSDEHPCGAHDRWKVIKKAALEFLEGTTLADVIDESAPSSFP